MEESTYEALYTGVYLFVFIIAVSSAVFLFNSVTKYADLSYEFGKEITGSVMENVPTSRYKVLTGSEVISYYFNYISHDLYDNANEKVSEYEIEITRGNTVVLNSSQSRLGYQELTTGTNPKINLQGKYILEYKGPIEGSNKIKIRIRLAEAGEVDQIMQETY